MKTFRTIVIDPLERRVYEHHLATGEIGEEYTAFEQALCAKIGCRSVTAAGLGAEVVAYLDEEGLLVDWDEQGFFRAKWYPHPLPGIHVIGGQRVGEDGEFPVDLPAFVTVEKVQELIEWMAPQDVVIPAPKVAREAADGTEVLAPLGGNAEGNWTYTHQPD